MLALKILAGLLFFVPLFIGVGVLTGGLAEKHHTAVAFAVLFTGIGLLLLLTAAYGHAVR